MHREPLHCSGLPQSLSLPSMLRSDQSLSLLAVHHTMPRLICDTPYSILTPRQNAT